MKPFAQAKWYRKTDEEKKVDEDSSRKQPISSFSGNALTGQYLLQKKKIHGNSSGNLLLLELTPNLQGKLVHSTPYPSNIHGTIGGWKYSTF